MNPKNAHHLISCDDKHRSWLVRFQRSRASPNWLIEVKPINAPEGNPQIYHFASTEAWLDWCAEVFERDMIETDPKHI